MQVNHAAVNKAKELIEHHQYVKESTWSEVQPSTEAENAFIERHDWETFSCWYLALDPDTSEATKERYKFPYGDFRRVHRSGLIAAKQRAAQNHYDAIEKAADELLDLFDKSVA